MSKTGRTSLHRLSFLVRKNTAKDQPPSFSYSSSSSEEAAPTVSSSFLTPSPASYSAPSPSSSSSSSSPAAPPSNKGSTTTPQKAAPGWRRSIGGFVGAWVPDEAVEGGSGLGSEYEEEEGWRVLREERDELQTQLESLLDIDAAQRGLLQRLLDQLTRHDGKGEASAAADPSTDEVTSLQRLVEDSAEASLVVHLRHENLLLRQKLAARDGGKAGGGDSGGMPATSAEVVEGGTALKEKQRKGKDKARSRTASTVFLDWPRRRGSSEASDAEEQQQQQQARDESETVPSDASQKNSKKNARRSRTLSFLSKSSKSLDARSEANGAPLKGTADSADDDDKQSSQKGGLFKRKERRKTITLDSTTTPVLLSASSASFSGAGGARRGDLNGTSNSNPFVLALNDEAAKLKALLTEQENKCANLNDQLLRAAEQLAEKNRAIAVLNQENDRLSHCVATLEQQLSQMRSGLSDAYRTLRKDSSAPEPKNLPHDSSHGGNNRATITVNIGSSGSTSSSPEAVTRKGSEERRPHTARERNTYRELEPTNSAAAEEVDVLKGNAEAKKPSVRMVVDALEVRLSEVYNIKNLATPRTGKDSPYSARRPSTSRASGKHASTRGSAVPSPRSARGAGVAPSAGQGNNWADLDEESLADEMPEAFIESGEEEALDCFQQEEAGPFFVASPPLTSEGNNEGNNMNSGDIASVAERDRSTANNNEVARQQYLCKKRLQVINELLATERRYASALKTLIKARLVYLEPLNAREHGIVTWEEINTMFSNIEDIWTLSKAFLEKLEQRARSWQDKETDEGHSDPIISDILIETFPMMRIYYPYCYNRDQASALRRQLVRTNPLWQSFVRLCQNRPECNNLDLAAFLIMPVQRIPRYQLLLKELIKYTSEGHVDKEGVTVALSIIASIAKEIDRKGPAASAIVPSLSSSLGEKRRDSSGSLHLTPAFKGETAEPDEHLVGQHYHCMDVGRYDAFVDVTRSWIKSDAIRTVCGWKEQLSWLYLFDDMVLAHNAPTFSNNLWTNNPTSTTRFRKTRSSVFAKAKHDMFGKLLLSEVWIRDLPDSTGDRKHMWQLCAPDVTFIFVSRSQAEKTEWLQAIASAIEQLMLVPGHKEHRHAVLAEITLRGTQHGSVRVNRRRTVTRAVSFAVLNKDKIAAEKEQEDAKEEEAEENISAHMPEGVLYLARNFVRGGLAWRGEPVDASCKFDSGKKTVANRKEKESSLGRGVSGLEALFMVDGAAKSSLRDSDGGSMRDHQGSAAAGGGGSGGRKGSGDRDGGEGGGDGSRRKGAQPSSGKQSNSQRSGLFGRRSTTSHASLSQRDLSSSVTARSTTTIKSLAVAVPSPSSADSHSSGSGATTARATSKRRSLRRNLSSLGITELLQHQSSSNSNDRRLSTSPDSVRGRVIQKGFLYHRDQTAEGGWNRRWCVLTFERLAIYAGQQSSEELTAVSLKNATIDLCESARPSGMHSFKLCNGEEIILATALEAEAMAWVSRIQDLISVCG